MVGKQDVRAVVHRFTQASRQRFHVFWFGFEVVQTVQRRAPRHLIKDVLGPPHGAPSGGFGMLREHRGQQELLDAFGAKGFQALLHAGHTVPERVRHDEVAFALLQSGHHAVRMDAQRCTFIHPNLGVGRRNALRTRPEDDASDQEMPQWSGQVDDVRVKQELPQVGAHRCLGGLLRRTDVHQQDAALGHGQASTLRT